MRLGRTAALALLIATAVFAQPQPPCGNVQLQLTPDYAFAIGSSSAGSQYTLSDAGQPIAQGATTQLALFHFDGSAVSSTLAPISSTGVSFVHGKFGSALALATGGLLSYSSGNLSFSDGTIELWFAPTKDGSDPIYAQYDHTLFRYTAANGDQLVLSESANGGFYAGVIIGGVYTGAGGVQIASLKANTWHHIAFTYSRSNSRIRVYLDGALTGEKDAALTMPAATGPSFTVDSTASHASAFLVDELRIASAEEPAAQIQYDATRSTPFADNEVMIPLAGVAPGQLTYSAGICGSATYTYTGIPLTNLTPNSNLLAPGSTSAALSFNTLQAASCGYSVNGISAYASALPFAIGQKSTTHQGTVSGLSASPLSLNTVYVQCDSNPDYVQTIHYRAVGGRSGPFPRLGSIWQGEYILSTKPDQAAKIQVYFGPGGMTASQANALRAQNPNVLILPSVNAQETTGGSPSVPASYLLHDVNGNPISDWPGNYLLNLTNPQVATFLAQYAFQQYFTNANLAFDGIFWDNFNTTIQDPYIDYQGVSHQISAANNGVADDPTALNTAWSQGIYTLIKAFDALAPNAYVAAHNAQPIPAQLAVFNGNSFTEDAPHVREGTEQFGPLLTNYNAWFAAGRQPAIAAIQSAPPSQIAYGYGYQPLQNITASVAQFSQTYYPYMRFGLATALMNDGFSIFDFGDSGAPVNWWYDEFDFNLGQPLGPAAPVSSGFGLNVLANGSFHPGLNGWSLLVNNDGQAAATAGQDTTLSADSMDTDSAEIQVTHAGTAQWHVDFETANLHFTAGTNYQVEFWARSSAPRSITVNTQGGAPNYPSYGLTAAFSLTTSWQYFTATFTAPVTATDGRLEFWFGDQTGDAWLDDVSVTPIQANVYRRDYSNGAVLLNGTGARQTVPLEPGFTRFTGSQAPLWQYIVDDIDAGFTADSSWQTNTYDTGDYGSGHYQPPFYHAWNKTVHLQTTPGTAAQWNLNIPADGQYTLQAWLPAAPGAANWTKSAVYEVVQNGAVIATYPVDQSAAAAGDAWHTLGTVSLTVAGAPFVRLHNGGSGATVADAIYVASANSLFNDGSAASQITLGPFDGILLKRTTPVAAPVAHISAVVDTASFQPVVTNFAFISVLGSGFGNTTRTWAASDFIGNQLPLALNGISVTINGSPAYVEFISPTQINIIVGNPFYGPVTVAVQTPQGPSDTATVIKQLLAPAFFTYAVGANTYAAAIHTDGTLVGPAGPGSRPAVPGEIVEIYGSGFGAPSPPVYPLQLIAQPAPIPFTPAVTIGGIAATVQYAGLVSNGLYQLNVVVPAIAAGDQPIQTASDGFQSPAGVFLTIGGGN